MTEPDRSERTRLMGSDPKTEAGRALHEGIEERLTMASDPFSRRESIHAYIDAWLEEEAARLVSPADRSLTADEAMATEWRLTRELAELLRAGLLHIESGDAPEAWRQDDWANRVRTFLAEEVTLRQALNRGLVSPAAREGPSDVDARFQELAQVTQQLATAMAGEGFTVPATREGEFDAPYDAAYRIVVRLGLRLAVQREPEPPASTLDLSGTERGDGYNREQQLARRIERWLDDLALAGSLSLDERRDIYLTVGQREDAPLDAEKEALAFIQEIAPLLTASMTDPKMVTALHRLMYRAEVLNVEPTDARESKPFDGELPGSY